MTTKKTNESIESTDEARLETDIGYRFQYVTSVVGLNNLDQAVLRKHRAIVEPHLSEIVDRAYKKMFEYDAMKRHFLPRHSGFGGEVPVNIDELKLDHAQTQFRKKRLKEYFVKLTTADWDDTFATLLDLVGHMHTNKGGNSLLEVPVIQVVTMLGVLNDLFLVKISELELSAKTQIGLQRAYTKLFWVQSSMFIRHWTN